MRYTRHLALALACAVPFFTTVILRAASPLTLDPFQSRVLTADADDDVAQSAADTPSTSLTRTGFLNLLDSRSIYGKDFFPEPLLADEADVDNEIALHYLHTEKRHAQTDQGTVEIEKSVGLLTLSIAGGYESDRSAIFNFGTNTFDHDNEQGATTIELAARYPLLEYVSPSGFFDNTLVFGLSIAPPTLSPISTDTEILPKFFDLLKVGGHFSLQLGAGVSTLIGPQYRGESTFEYDAVFAYQLPHDDLPLPFVASTTPILEFDGETLMNKSSSGQNALSAVFGSRFTLNPIGDIQPNIGVGLLVPLDSGGREESHWGMVTSLIFEY